MKKPKRPVKERVTEILGEILIEDLNGELTAGITELEKFKQHYDTYDSICLEDDGGFEGPTHFEVFGSRMETQDEYRARYAKYKVQLAKYEQWYAENKKRLDAEKASKIAKLKKQIRELEIE
jgi:hypothetical protein